MTGVLSTPVIDVALGQAGRGAGRAGQGAVDHGALASTSRRSRPSPEPLVEESCTCTPRKPVAPMWIVELAPPLLDALGHRERGADRDGVGLGLPPSPVEPVEAAVSMPTTLPSALTRAPPESPGWMSAVRLDEAGQVLRVAPAAVTGGDRLVQRR